MCNCYIAGQEDHSASYIDDILNLLQDVGGAFGAYSLCWKH